MKNQKVWVIVNNKNIVRLGATESLAVFDSKCDAEWMLSDWYDGKVHSSATIETRLLSEVAS